MNLLIQGKELVMKVIFSNRFGKKLDHLDWDFVDYMLYRLGFEAKRSGWIRECIVNTSLI